MINVTKTYIPNVEKYKEYVDKIFASGWFTNNGVLTQELEHKLSEYLGVRNIILVSNGTLALQVSYKLLNLSGDVLTTPFSFVATTSSICWEGLNPIFVDIDKDNINIDVNKIEQNITEKTTAIVAVHVFGNICNVEKIEYIANKHNLKVIYDGAHAFGVNYKGKSALEYGDLTTLSFHSTKVFHSIEGGAIIIKDDELYKKAKLMINFGIPGPDEVLTLGINAKMNEFQSAMGLCVLDDIEEILKARKYVYDSYMDKLSNISNIKLQTINEHLTQNYGYFPIILENEEILTNIIIELNKENIFPRRYFYPSLDTLPYIKNKFDVPISNYISKRILCLPIFEGLSERNVQKIVSIIYKNIIKN